MILPIGLGFPKINIKHDVRRQQPGYSSAYFSTPLYGDVFQKRAESSAPINHGRVSDLTFGYNFSLKHVKGIPCAYCGGDVVSKEDLHEIVYMKGAELVDRLDSYYKQNPESMGEQQKKSFELLKEVALENPDKTAEELLPILFVDARERLIEKQSKIYDEVEEMAHDLKSRSLVKYIRYVRNQDAVLRQDISFDELSDFLVNKQHVEYRKQIIKNIENIRNSPEAIKNNHAKTWDRIISKVDELPSSKSDEDAYLVKFISKAIKKNINDVLIPKNLESSEMFYAQILYPFLSTAEHIKPFSKKGVSDYSNYLVTHAHCNGERGDRPWVDYMFEDPKRLDMVSSNLSIASEKIEENPKKFKNLGVFDYIPKVSATLKRELRRYSQNAYVGKFLDDLSKIQSHELSTHKKRKNISPSSAMKPLSVEKLAEIKHLKGSELCSELRKYASLLSQNESMVKIAAIEKVSQWASDNPTKDSEELLSVFYENAKKTFLKNRAGVYSRLLQESYGETPLLSDTIINLQKKDPVYSDSRVVSDERIRNFLSDKNQAEYNDFLFDTVEDLTNNTPSIYKTAKWSKFIRKLPNALSPEHKASGYLTKLLVDVRHDDGSFDTDEFYERLLSN